MAYNLNAKIHVLKNGNERVTSDYGNRSLKFNGKIYNGFHHGIDLISSKYGKDYIISFEEGTIFSIRNDVSGYNEQIASGNYVFIKHKNGYETRYMHLKKNSLKVKVGQKIKKGQVIAFMNSSGFSTGDHLHFEIRRNGKSLNPKNYLLGKKVIVKSDNISTKSYIVKKGDSLWAIAEKYYGNGSKYKEIAKLNNIKKPYIIYPGERLKMK